MKNKEDAKGVYMDIVKHSWTYDKMTLDEQQRCLTAVFGNDVNGTFSQRCYLYAILYDAFLGGLGYDGAMWRATEEEKAIWF